VDGDEVRKPFVEVSGRKGLGVKIDDLLDLLVENATAEVKKRNPDFSEADCAHVGRQIGVAAIRRITQQVNAFFCQNLSSETFPDGYWKFVDCWNARDQRDAWSRARRPEVKLISNASIRNCFCAFRDTS